MISKNAKMLHLHFKRYPNSYNVIFVWEYIKYIQLVPEFPFPPAWIPSELSHV